jgi:putative ATP-dependent DNA ligase
MAMLDKTLRAAHEHRKVRREHYPGGEYLRLTDGFQGLPRGTAIFGETLVYGYPQVGRIVRLDQGLREQIQGSFWAEEKIDGYNVRIARIGDRVLAFTRGGFDCPFTTDRLPDLIDLSFFEAHPDLVLCAEAAGPDTPYVVGHPPHVTEDVRLFVFDIMRLGAPGFLPLSEKYALVDTHGLPAVDRFGPFTARDYGKVRDILRELNEKGREGLVFKEDRPNGRRVKYVTADSSVTDIEVNMHDMLQLPPAYFTGRILRLALFEDEVGREATAELAGRLGEAFLDGLSETLEQFRRDRRVYDTFRCRFRDPANAARLLERIRRSDRRVHVSQRRLLKEGDLYLLEFDKVYDAMTGLLNHLLKGGVVYD